MTMPARGPRRLDSFAAGTGAGAGAGAGAEDASCAAAAAADVSFFWRLGAGAILYFVVTRVCRREHRWGD